MKKKIAITLAAVTLTGAAVMALADTRGFGGCDGDEGRGHHSSFQKHGKGSEMMGARMLSMLDWQLELTEEQRNQIRSLIKERELQGHPEQNVRREMLALDPASSDFDQQVERLARQQADGMAQQMMQQAKLYGQIYAILTPEQQQQFAQLKQRWGQKWSENRGGKWDRHQQGRNEDES